MAFVREISTAQAKEIILKYEWLGTAAPAATFCAGLFSGRDPRGVKAWQLVDADDNIVEDPIEQRLSDVAPYTAIAGPDGSVDELIGVACMGWPGGIQSRDICGKEFRSRTIAIERGTCVHWAHRHSASFLIPKACRLAYDTTESKFCIFYAYSDVSAGEIGTVYQACNWRYIGQGVGRTPGRMREKFIRPGGGVPITSRALRHLKLKKLQVLAMGWTVIKEPPKHKYVWFEGSRSERRRAVAACRYPFLPYPKWLGDSAETAAIAAEVSDTPEVIADEV